MKILLDNCVDVRLRHHMTRHTVYTALYMGWDNLSNGALLQAAEADGFDILLTTDKNLWYQQSMATVESRSSFLIPFSANCRNWWPCFPLLRLPQPHSYPAVPM